SSRAPPRIGPQRARREGSDRHARRRRHPPVVSRRARRPEDAIATRRQTRGGCGKYIRSLFTILFFAVLLTIGGGWFFWRAMTSPYRGYSEPAKRVEIRKGQRTATILHHLQAEGVIRDEYIPLVYMKLA